MDISTPGKATTQRKARKEKQEVSPRNLLRNFAPFLAPFALKLLPLPHFASGITEVCSFTNSCCGNFVGPSTAIFGKGPRTIATSSQA